MAKIRFFHYIEARWDERNERADEREVLLALKAEFEENKREARAVIDRHEDVTQRMREFKSMRPDSIEAMAPVEYRLFVAAFTSPRTFDPQRGSVRALIGAGNLGILRDHALRDALMSFMTIDGDADEDRYYMGETSLWVWRKLLRLGGPGRMLPASYEPDSCKGVASNRYCYIAGHTSRLPDIGVTELSRTQNDKVIM